MAASFAMRPPPSSTQTPVIPSIRPAVTPYSAAVRMRVSSMSVTYRRTSHRSGRRVWIRSPASGPQVREARLLQRVLHRGHVAVRVGPVDDPMIERKTKDAHRADGDRVVDHHGALLDDPDTHDGHLRLVDDRR